jgi:hypothetical protein
LKQAPPPRSLIVSGASAVAVEPFAVWRRHSPFGSDTVRGQIHAPTVARQRTSPRLL